MGKVRLEFIAWLAGTLDTEEDGDDVIFEQQIEGDRTVKHLLDQLAVRFPRFGQSVFDHRIGKLSDRVCIFLNGTHLELLNGLSTELSDGDVLSFVPSMQGG